MESQNAFALIVVYALISLVGIVFGVLNIVCKWMIFKKAGQPGWAALVPFYNIYIMQIIAFEKSKWPFMFLLFAPVINVAYELYLQFNFARAYGLSTGAAVAYLFFAPFIDFYLAFGEGVRYQGTQEFLVK